MTENMLMLTFKDLDDAKKVYEKLKKANNDAEVNYQVLQTVLLKNDGGKINVLDHHAGVFDELEKTMIGGVVGVVLGVLIGPFAGFVLGGVGAMIGSGFDITEQSETENMLYQMYSRIYDGEIAILAIVQEEDELELNSTVGHLTQDIYRWDAAEIKEEAEYATDIRDSLLRQAKMELKKEKSENRKKKIEEYKENIKKEFKKIGKKKEK
ncbi:hypothetical protein SAMN05216454_11012 [Peptostreptococcus russellii]|uniref:DUF1269 domain-containing protein n=1 Tax=Peptostreptococcus russellii TaxID=215200 RepID=A0A1H8IYW5_9FIRM|nr:hypothetical protein [Peptostreptococcus russellii]SEN73549.1 hypothetical protein SAMN05216454_11012 [Peptostreptococcus russellii]